MISENQTAQLLESARKRLLETGTRNRLVHVNRDLKRSNSLNIIDESSDHVFELLRVKQNKMKFYATKPEPTDEESALEEGGGFLPSPFEPVAAESRKTDKYLDTPLTPSAMQKRLLKLFRDAWTAEEEQGVNVLYLAMGFLQWQEARSSSMLRESPLILLPVELVRNERSSTYDIICRDDDVVTNLPLQQRLREDFGIELPEIDDARDWVPADYFQSVRECVGSRSNWKIDADGMQLGFFSFAKLLMLRDLDPENWPADALTHSELVARLLGEGFEREAPLFPEDAQLDRLLDPATQLQVVDADASQVKVIEEVRSGRNLVVQGPPGTGKSQTITNILATAAFDGKTVLFVAEKMAALKVVHRRMSSVGLEDMCLELHSKSANKRAVLQELKATLSRAGTGGASGNTAVELRQSRDELNRITDLLHEPLLECPKTPFEALGELVGFIGKGQRPPQFSASWLGTQTNADFDRRVSILAELSEAISAVGTEADHPFFGVANLELQPVDIERLVGEIDDALARCGTLAELASALMKGFGIDHPVTFQQVDRLISLLERVKSAPSTAQENTAFLAGLRSDQKFLDALEAGARWQKIRQEISNDFVDAALEHPIIRLRTDLSKGAGSLLSRIFGKYRSASAELSTLLKTTLPKQPAARIRLLDDLREAQKACGDFRDQEASVRGGLSARWRGDKTDLIELAECAKWVAETTDGESSLSAEALETLLRVGDQRPELAGELRKALLDTRQAADRPVERLQLKANQPSITPSNLPLNQLCARLHQLKDNSSRYGEWVRLEVAKRQCAAEDLSDMLALISQGKLEAKEAVDEFRYATCEEQWAVARAKRPDLAELQHVDRHKLVERFQKLDRRHTSSSQDHIRTRHLAQLPQGAFGEMGYLRGEMAKKKRHRPIRQSMINAGAMVQRIKPVMMMSPISVAQFLPPGKIEFDLLVIDEASQVRPEEALGAIARCRQIVVVGDQKQLPPTNFFGRLAETSDDDLDEEEGKLTVKAEEMESILTLCDARGLSSSMLEYHYRSKDPSLIAVSNLEFYENRLLMPPSPDEPGELSGLSFVQVPGVYTSQGVTEGRAATNRIEAQHVVSELAKHAESGSTQSIGIVTFSKSQADMMTEVIEHARRKNNALDEFLAKNLHEDVFVKNIENVQGDERDIILVSVGYGPAKAAGRLSSMRFGPINTEGGERRLNVLFTRSRIACRIFASFDPVEIDLSRTTSVGIRILKRFLEFAKSGVLEEKLETGREADSPFETDVAKVIEALGYPVEMQVGTAGFRVDLGVKHPIHRGMYILAVECDGAAYHSSIWARERDRQRQEILEGFGWKFHRIWSTDWFHNRGPEIEKLREALARARSAAEAPSSASEGANLASAIDWNSELAETADRSEVVELAEANLDADPYVRFSTRWNSNAEPHEVATATMSNCVAEVVQVEGPIHSEEVGRRIANAFGRAKAGGRIQQAVLNGLRYSNRAGKIETLGDFWFTAEQREKPKVRDRSEETQPTTKPEYLSDIEIWAAAEYIQNHSGNMEQDELVRAISRLLGFKRAGGEFQARVVSGLRQKPSPHND